MIIIEAFALQAAALGTEAVSVYIVLELGVAMGLGQLEHDNPSVGDHCSESVADAPLLIATDAPRQIDVSRSGARAALPTVTVISCGKVAQIPVAVVVME